MLTKMYVKAILSMPVPAQSPSPAPGPSAPSGGGSCNSFDFLCGIKPRADVWPQSFRDKVGETVGGVWWVIGVLCGLGLIIAGLRVVVAKYNNNSDDVVTGMKFLKGALIGSGIVIGAPFLFAGLAGLIQK